MMRRLTACSYHVKYAFQIQSTFYSCLNVKELFPQKKHDIWYLSYCNVTRTHNHLPDKQTPNYIAQQAK